MYYEWHDEEADAIRSKHGEATSISQIFTWILWRIYLYSDVNRIGKVYPTEHSDILEMFFMPRRVGFSCTNTIPGHGCAMQCCLLTVTLGCSYTNIIRDCIVVQQWEPLEPLSCKLVPTFGPLVLLLWKKRQTDMDTTAWRTQLDSRSSAYRYRLFLKWIYIKMYTFLKQTLYEHAITCPGKLDSGYHRSVVRICFSSYHFWMAITVMGIISHIGTGYFSASVS